MLEPHFVVAFSRRLREPSIQNFLPI